ncbi:hypothetical protein ABY45_03600, partial [Microbacterium maritypicum]
MTSEPRILPLPGSGAHLVVGADGRPRIRLRTGRFALVDAPPAELFGALESDAESDAALTLDRVTREVQEREAADALRRWPVDRRAVCLIGTGPFVDELERMLAGWGAQVTVVDTASEPVDDAALVIAYAEGAHDRRRWAALDLLPQRGI